MVAQCVCSYPCGALGAASRSRFCRITCGLYPQLFPPPARRPDSRHSRLPSSTSARSFSPLGARALSPPLFYSPHFRSTSSFQTVSGERLTPACLSLLALPLSLPLSIPRHSSFPSAHASTRTPSSRHRCCQPLSQTLFLTSSANLRHATLGPLQSTKPNIEYSPRPETHATRVLISCALISRAMLVSPVDKRMRTADGRASNTQLSPLIGDATGRVCE